MAATATQQKQDNRKPNFTPNHLPEQITADLFVGGELLGSIGVSQGVKLSLAGAITYFGGITKGWRLDGDSSTVLASLGFAVNGVKLSVSKHGVHANKAGNPCVFHSAVIALPNAKGEPMPYMVAITATFRGTDGYQLQILSSPVRAGGPVVRGEITGDLVIDGYEG